MSKAVSATARACERAREASVPVTVLAAIASLSAAALVLAVGAALAELVAHPELVDSGLFLGSFVALLPLCLLAMLFLAGSEQVARRLPGSVIATGIGFVALLGLTRLFAEGHREAAVLVLAGAILLLAWEALTLFGPSERPSASVAKALDLPAWALATSAALLLICLLLAFAPPRDVTVSHCVLALLVSTAIAVVYSFVRPLARPGWLLVLADVLVVALILAAVLDLTVYTTATSPSFGFADPVSIGLTTRQYQQDPYLAAIDDVLHGKALLVDTASQYGVGSIYLLAGLFKIAPIGYGPFGLFATFFTGVEIALGYVVTRLACRRWWLPAGAAIVAVVVVGALQSTAFLPSQGGLRFAPPLALLLLALLGVRRRTDPTPITPGSLGALALASVWSIETFVFSAAILIGLLTFFLAATSSSAHDAWRKAVGALARMAGVSLGAIALLTLLTRLLAGAWPDWGWYVSYATAYSSGPAQLPVGAWSPVWILGGIYFASLVGTIGALLLRRSAVQGNLLRFTTLAGASVAGLAFLVYFVNRSVDSLLVLFALPAIMSVCVWLDLALDLARSSRRLRGISVAAVAWLAAFLVIVSWPVAKGVIESSALAQLPPGGKPLRADLSAIWSSPPIDPRSVVAQELIERRFGSGEPLVFLEPDLATETLMRSRRTDLLPIGFPAGHGIAPSAWRGRLRDDVEALEAGTLVLLQRHPPGPNGEPAEPVGPLFAERVFGQVHPDSWLSPPAEIALRMVKQRFDLQPVAVAEDGLVVARLEPKNG